jgi:hypothetical protein
MNKEDLADRICAIAYPCGIHKGLILIAKGSGLVIVYGASDSMGFGKRRVVQGVDRRGNAGLPRSACAVAAPVSESWKGWAEDRRPCQREHDQNYQKDHADIVWSEAIPDLNISEITG